jgi:hypothetical protein
MGKLPTSEDDMGLDFVGVDPDNPDDQCPAVSAVRRGVAVRRARIVSEPVSDYVRWEHWLTEPVNIAAGEQVRWLPRRLASTLAVPGNPYWVFDHRLVRFTLFGGDGEVQGSQYSDDAGVIEACRTSFGAVWRLAVPHQEYRI